MKDRDLIADLTDPNEVAHPARSPLDSADGPIRKPSSPQSHRSTTDGDDMRRPYSARRMRGAMSRAEPLVFEGLDDLHKALLDEQGDAPSTMETRALRTDVPVPPELGDPAATVETRSNPMDAPSSDEAATQPWVRAHPTSVAPKSEFSAPPIIAREVIERAVAEAHKRRQDQEAAAAPRIADRRPSIGLLLGVGAALALVGAALSLIFS